MKAKIIITFLFIYSLASMPNVGAANTGNLKDISGHWAEAQIKSAVVKGYVNGYQDGTFKPEAPVSGEEFLAMMVRALKIPTESQLSEESWFSPIYKSAGKSGIYQGDYQKGWDQPLTRGDMALTLERATRQRSFKQLAESSPQSRIQDIDSMHNNMEPKQMVYESVRRGLMTGTSSTELSLDSTTTRAQAVVVIERVISYNAGESLPIDRHTLEVAEVFWHSTNLFTVWSNFLGIENANKFDTTKLHIETDFFVGDITGLYIIDANDPDSLYWDKIQYPLSELYRKSYKDAYPVEDTKDAYYIVHSISENEIENSQHRALINISINGVGEDPVAYFNAGDVSAMRERLENGSFEVKEVLLLRKHTVPKVGEASHQINGKYFDSKVAVPICIVPKYNVLVDHITIDVSTTMIGDGKNQRVLNIWPTGIRTLKPYSSDVELYMLEELN
ncbi:S-layer homology domain-containing protein [Paenibacillus sp. RC67]|uniref:S-layer homology domain-containing protein n=1 Tax=Paenibacillus sp. RC67 TaxID=3039392 RepID=UPI0024AE65CC|nr:S-layer homology domain-containing protein [Paenibacillus sp. RC67]